MPPQSVAPLCNPSSASDIDQTIVDDFIVPDTVEAIESLELPHSEATALEDQEESLHIRDLYKFMKTLAEICDDVRFFPPSLAFVEQTQNAFKQHVPVVVQADYVLGSVAVFELFPNENLQISVDAMRITKLLGIIAERFGYPLHTLKKGNEILASISPRASNPVPGVARYVNNDEELINGIEPIEATHHFPFVVTELKGQISIFFNFEDILSHNQLQSLVTALRPARLPETSPVGHEQYLKSLKKIFRYSTHEILPETEMPRFDNKTPLTRSSRAATSIAHDLPSSRIQMREPLVTPTPTFTSADEERMRRVEEDLVRRGLLLPSTTR